MNYFNVYFDVIDSDKCNNRKNKDSITINANSRKLLKVCKVFNLKDQSEFKLEGRGGGCRIFLKELEGALKFVCLG